MIVIIAALIRCPVMPKSMGNFYHTYIYHLKYILKLIIILYFSASKNNNREGWQFSTIPAASSSDEDVNE